MTETTVVLRFPIPRCDEVVSKFCKYDSSYSNYDSQPVLQDNVLRVEEIRLSHKMGARFPNTLITELIGRSNIISKALSQISPSSSILDAYEQIPWEALEELFKACVIPRMGEANITKILHKKRPQLIPILDSVVVQQYLEPLLMANPDIPKELEKKLVFHIKQLKQDADANREALERLSACYRLSAVRILDILIWTYFRKPEWWFFTNAHAKEQAVFCTSPYNSKSGQTPQKEQKGGKMDKDNKNSPALHSYSSQGQNLSSVGGIYVRAKITSQGKANKYRYKTGPAAGLERAEIRVPKAETAILPYSRHQYPVDVTVVIGQREYAATLRFAGSQHAAWISSVLGNGNFELVRALNLGGFKICQYVRLKVLGKRIWVL